MVSNISFGLDEKINTGLLGPNGAGKSTTINMMINKIKKNHGNLIFKDVLVGKSMYAYFN